MKFIRRLIKFIVPHGIVELRRKALFRKFPPSAAIPDPPPDRTRFHETRKRVLAIADTIDLTGGRGINGMDRNQVAEFLLARGVPDQHLIAGSIPTASLSFLHQQISTLVPSAVPVYALHIGNFVGVSLAYVAEACRQHHKNSLVVAIDPNVPHRGVSNPQEHVAALLCACGLQRNTMLIAGYSGVKSVSNDGVTFESYHPGLAFANESACEQTLLNLGKILPKTFHLAVVDGNHQASYLIEEIHQLKPLMRPGGIIVFDDVDANWNEIKDVFENLPQLGLITIATDGRIGIAQIAA